MGASMTAKQRKALDRLECSTEGQVAIEEAFSDGARWSRRETLREVNAVIRPHVLNCHLCKYSRDVNPRICNRCVEGKGSPCFEINLKGAK